MRFIVGFVLLTAIDLHFTDAARWCMSGSGKTYHEKLCGTAGDYNVDCHQFRCEGGRSPFVLRTCGDESRTIVGCQAGIVTCNRAGGTGTCYTCNRDNCNREVKEGIPTGNRGNSNGENNHNNNNGGNRHSAGGSNSRNGGNGHSRGNNDRGGHNSNGENRNRDSLISKLINALIKGSSN